MAEPLPMREDEQSIVVELDNERHADLDLSHLGRKQDKQYRAVPQEDGTILLKPELTDEQLEDRLLANPELLARIEEAMANPELMRPRPQRNR